MPPTVEPVIDYRQSIGPDTLGDYIDAGRPTAALRQLIVLRSNVPDHAPIGPDNVIDRGITDGAAYDALVAATAAAHSADLITRDRRAAPTYESSRARVVFLA